MKDPLYQFFKKKLTRDIPDADWNIPSDEVWDKAKPHFPAPRRHRRLLLLLPLLLLVSGAVLGLWIAQRHNAARRTSPRHPNPRQAVTPANSPILSHPGKNDGQASTDPMIPAKPYPKPEANKVTRAAALVATGDQGEPKPPLAGRALRTTASPPAGRNHTATVKATAATSRVARRPYWNVLHPLPLLVRHIAAKAPVVIPAPARPGRRHVRAELYTRLTGGTGRTQSTAAQNMRMPIHWREYEAGFRIPIRRHWAFQAGLSVLQLKQNFKTSTATGYDPDTELAIGGGMVSARLHFGPKTPIGTYSLDAVVVHAANISMPAGERIDLMFAGERRLHYVNVHAGLRYSKAVSERLHAFAGLETGMGIRTGAGLTAHGQLSHNGEPMEMAAMHTTPGHTAARYLYTVRLETGISGSLTRHLSLAAGASYTRSLRPLYRDAETITHLTAILPQVSVSYHF